MADERAETVGWWVRWGGAAWRAGLGVFFAAVLLIPKVGRLRRRVRVWTLLRVAAIVGGGWLAWRVAQGEAGAGGLVLGLILGLALLVFGLAVGPLGGAKSVDDEGRARGALVVLNGGTYVPMGDSRPTRAVRIFVHPERLDVLDRGHQALVEIPLSGVSAVRVKEAKEAESTEYAVRRAGWRLVLEWDDGRAEFHYEGYFGEHLARVAEKTICNVVKKALPVLKA